MKNADKMCMADWLVSERHDTTILDCIKTLRHWYENKSGVSHTWLFITARKHWTPTWMSSLISPKFNFAWKDFERCGKVGRLSEKPRCNELLVDFELSEPFGNSFCLHTFEITNDCQPRGLQESPHTLLDAVRWRKPLHALQDAHRG